MLIYQVITYHKMSDTGLLTQATCSIRPVQLSVRKGLKEQPKAFPSHRSLLVLRPQAPLLPGGSVESLQDCCFASTDSMRLSIPAVCLVSPARLHSTGRILGSQTGLNPPTYRMLTRGRYWYSLHRYFSIIPRRSPMRASSSASSLNNP